MFHGGIQNNICIIYMKQTMWVKLLINFLLGGTIVASVSYIATFMNPVLASIWWSFPLSIIPSMYFMNKMVNPINIYLNFYSVQPLH